MEDIKAAVAEAVNGSTDESSLPAQVEGNDAPTGGQQSAESQVNKPFDHEWWKKDSRMGRTWKDEQTFSKAAWNADQLIEKQYKPLKAQAEQFTKLFSDYGFKADPSEIKQALDELKSFRDPENPVIKRGNYFSYFYDNPEYQPEIDSFFENFRRKEIRKQFGEGVSDEIVKEILESRKFREEQTEKENRLKSEQENQKIVGDINKGWERVEKEAKAIGFPIKEGVREALLDECGKQGVPPQFIYQQFAEMYHEEIEKHRRAKIQSDINATRMKQHKSGVIPPSSRVSNAAPSGKKLDIMDRVKNSLGLNK